MVLCLSCSTLQLIIFSINERPAEFLDRVIDIKVIHANTLKYVCTVCTVCTVWIVCTVCMYCVYCMYCMYCVHIVFYGAIQVLNSRKVLKDSLIGSFKVLM